MKRVPEIHVVGSMIVKNEAENLPALFASAEGIVDAWVIVDTGSTDETISVARALGDEHAAPVYIIEDPWDDDFARSRNVGLDAIEEIAGISDWNDPWILILDGDDRIDGDRKAFCAALLDPDPVSYTHLTLPTILRV
jgi:glycosyltransferase involved in cell wall biosynthesis